MTNLKEDFYKQKYLKYKVKYIKLKNQLAGGKSCGTKEKKECDGTIGCEWDKGGYRRNPTCKIKKCEEYGKMECGSVPGCVHEGDKCVEMCSQRKAKLGCGYDAGCEWHTYKVGNKKIGRCEREQE